MEFSSNLLTVIVVLLVIIAALLGSVIGTVFWSGAVIVVPLWQCADHLKQIRIAVEEMNASRFDEE